jgi:hypothetical protein
VSALPPITDAWPGLERVEIAPTLDDALPLRVAELGGRTREATLAAVLDLAIGRDAIASTWLDSPVVSNTSAETTILNVDLPAGLLANPGAQLEYQLAIETTITSTPTVIVRSKVIQGLNTSTGILAPFRPGGRPHIVRGVIVGRGDDTVHHFHECNAVADAAGAVASIDLTQVVTLSWSVQWSAASPSNTVTPRTIYIRRVK